MTQTVHPRQILDLAIAAQIAAIVTAVEALPEPETYQEAERAAKALIVMSRLVDKLYPTNEHGEAIAIDRVEARLTAAKVAPNRQQRRKAMVLARASG